MPKKESLTDYFKKNFGVEKDQKPRTLTQPERSAARIDRQEWLPDDPQKAFGTSWIPSTQAVKDSVTQGLRPSPKDEASYTEKILKLQLKEKAAKEGIQSLSDEQGRLLYGAPQWDKLKKGESATTRYNNIKKSLMLKELNNTLSKDDKAKLERIRKQEKAGKEGQSFSELLKDYKTYDDLVNATMEVPADSLDAKGNKIPYVKEKPYYPEQIRTIAKPRLDKTNMDMKWMSISEETGLPTEQVKTLYEQGKAAVLPIMQDYKNGKLPYSPDGFKKILNDKLAPFGIDYEDLLEFDKRLSQ